MTSAAHAIGSTDVSLLEETIGAAFDRTVATHGDREALVVPFQGIRLTYDQLAEQVDRLARGLLGLGLVTGDRLGMWSPNNAEWVYVQFAAAKTGVILVNINPAYQTEELRFALAQSGCRALIAATSFKSSDYSAMVTEVRSSLPDLEHVVFLDTPDWNALLEIGDGVPAERLAARSASLNNNEPINIQYTSGTTGFPKGATLSHRNLLNNGYFLGKGFRYSDTDRVCIPVPFYHCFGMVIGNLANLTHATTTVLPAPSFDPLATLQTLDAERCTSVLGVPTMFIAMLSHAQFPDFNLGSLRTGMMAGSPCPIEVMKQCVDEMHMHEVTIGYGMTETSPVSTQTSPDDPLDKRVGTVGRVLPHVQVKIADPVTGVTLRAQHGRRTVHQGVLGDARLLERTADDRRRHRRRWMDAQW